MSALVTWLHMFLRHVERDGECWIWTGRLGRGGYGRNGGRLAHRDAYQRLVGPIPDGRELDHICRRRACVNPLHLQPVTHLENVRRGMAAKTHCKRGHEFTAENTRVHDGKRICMACRHIRKKAEVRARALNEGMSA